jgi:hypothetical protein
MLPGFPSMYSGISKPPVVEAAVDSQSPTQLGCVSVPEKSKSRAAPEFPGPKSVLTPSCDACTAADSKKHIPSTSKLFLPVMSLSPNICVTFCNFSETKLPK